MKSAPQDTTLPTDSQSINRNPLPGIVRKLFGSTLPPAFLETLFVRSRPGKTITSPDPHPVTDTHRITCDYTGHLNALPEQTFPLLCPVLEYAWLPGWRADMIYSESGVAEEGAVFRTNIVLGEIWYTSRFHPPAHIQYIVFTGPAIMVLDVTLLEEEGGCSVRWKRTYTTISGLGVKMSGSFDKDEIQREMRRVHESLNHYLETGRKIYPDSNWKEQ